MMSKINQTDIDRLIELVGGRGKYCDGEPLYYSPALCPQPTGQCQTERN
ncbi:PTS system trehalose-specific EIIBC component domain protein [Shigella flexneri 1235-66]|nr:PTS system trehalose-specific EIIBC component domain protein [Shigella flexneri 1235-66]